MESHDAKMLRKQLRRMGAVAVNKGSGEVFGRQMPTLRTTQPVNPIALLTPSAPARPLTPQIDKLKSRTRVRPKKGSATQVLIHESASPAQRAKLTRANLEFANATDRAAKILAAKSVLKEIARVAGIKAIAFEVPALSYILAVADDCLDGRNPQFWRAVPGVDPPPNRSLAAPQRLALSCLLQCGAIAAKIIAAKSKKDGTKGVVSFRAGMTKAVDDLEGLLGGALINHFLGDGEESDESKSSDKSERSARWDRLVKRLTKDRRKLDAGTCDVSTDYRIAIKMIEAMDAGTFIAQPELYQNALVATKTHLIQARVDSDDLIDPKSGKGA